VALEGVDWSPAVAPDGDDDIDPLVEEPLIEPELPDMPDPDAPGEVMLPEAPDVVSELGGALVAPDDVDWPYAAPAISPQAATAPKRWLSFIFYRSLVWIGFRRPRPSRLRATPPTPANGATAVVRGGRNDMAS